MDLFSVVTGNRLSKPQQTARWAPERRLEFIDFRLQWDRTINRAELTSHFGISPQQASADLAQYLESFPGNMEYDRSGKMYRATSSFRPQRADAGSSAYLVQLAEIAAGSLPKESTPVGWMPPCDVLRLPERTVEPETLLALQQAIRRGADIQVKYQSMRWPEATKRWIAPHALASDGLRWHARAWCYDTNAFQDFVLSRIQAVLTTRARSAHPPLDIEWQTPIKIVIHVRSGLSKAQRRATEAEYGMTNGRLVLSCRRALAFYLLRLMHLDIQQETLPPIQQPLEVLYSNELAEVIAAARKTPTMAPIDDTKI